MARRSDRLSLRAGRLSLRPLVLFHFSADSLETAFPTRKMWPPSPKSLWCSCSRRSRSLVIPVCNNLVAHLEMVLVGVTRHGTSCLCVSERTADAQKCQGRRWVQVPATGRSGRQSGRSDGRRRRYSRATVRSALAGGRAPCRWRSCSLRSQPLPQLPHPLRQHPGAPAALHLRHPRYQVRPRQIIRFRRHQIDHLIARPRRVPPGVAVVQHHAQHRFDRVALAPPVVAVPPPVQQVGVVEGA